MSVYEYSGLDKSRKKVNGIVDAENLKAARMKLRRMGVYPERLTLEGGKKKLSLSANVDFSAYFQRIKVEEIAMMTRQFATLLSAGVPLVESIVALIDQIENPKLKKILTEVRAKVVEGGKLSESLKGYPKVFDNLYVNMINAGESSGALDAVMARLSDFTEKQSALKSKVISAMIYPIIMSVVGALLMVGLMVGVVPKVTKIFEDVDATLPLPTQILIATSDALVDYWYLFLLAIPLLVFGIKKIWISPKGREWFDKKALTMPLFGKMNRLVAIARISRTLATLLSSGVPLLSSLSIVTNIVDNTIIRRVMINTRTSVQEGASFAEPLKRSGEFPPLVTHMIAVGEKTGELEKMLERVADNYDTQVDNTVSALTTLLEPMMILVMAGIVSFIVMSILLPILQLNQL